jgi:hypothetical protein
VVCDFPPAEIDDPFREGDAGGGNWVFLMSRSGNPKNFPVVACTGMIGRMLMLGDRDPAFQSGKVSDIFDSRCVCVRFDRLFRLRETSVFPAEILISTGGRNLDF